MEKKYAKLRLVLPLTLALLGWSSLAMADGGNPPPWWDNPGGLFPFHTQWETNGELENFGGQAQTLTAVVDVPNQFNNALSKVIWIQIEWAVERGSAALLTAPDMHRIMWLNGTDPIRPCPSSPSDPYPTPDGSEFLTNVGSYAPITPSAYTDGYELTIGPINPQPACERLQLEFSVDPNSRLIYRIEVQTIGFEGVDWGDAPENIILYPNYPTTITANGAQHMIASGLSLGAEIDGESDGTPSINADGDDNYDTGSADDEDGVVDPSQLVLIENSTPGIDLNVMVPNGVTAYLNGWIDYNYNGVWTDPGEAAASIVNIVGTGAMQMVTLNFSTVPQGLAPLSTYARFRLSTVQAAVSTPAQVGAWNTTAGEVEDYEIMIQEELIDFGDAPENSAVYPNYPTLLASNGARHRIVQGLTLGNEIDPEADGQPDDTATGDDLSNTGSLDDEDGVANPAQLILVENSNPIINMNVNVPSGQTAYLNGWIDYSGNGIWTDPGEAAISMAVIAGTGLPQLTTLTFAAVPVGSAPVTFARFRLSTSQNAVGLPETPAGTSIPDGEVEDYQILIEPQVFGIDFGDAPENIIGSPNYPTLQAGNGARHTIVPGLMIGSVIDPELDGQPSADGLADDNTTSPPGGPDDEDGIVDLTQLQVAIGDNPAVDINVTVPINVTAYLNGWIDYNNNGSWLDPGEAATTILTISGIGVVQMVALNFPTVPAGYLGQTFARFRLSTDRTAVSEPTTPAMGDAPDGEVEDHGAEILVPVELSSFSAIYANNAVRLEWITQSETENLGFHIYRSEIENGSYDQITDRIIPGAGNSESVHQYNYTDQTIEEERTYYYKLADISFNGRIRMNGPIQVHTAPTGYQLGQNYPNPFNPQTTIIFSTKESGMVEVTVYNMRGQLVRSLVSRNLNSGQHSVIWDGKDDSGRLMPTGNYLYKLKTKSFEETKSMQFIK